jgi:hypothetical protein
MNRIDSLLRTRSDQETDFAEQVCLSSLKNSQNQNGGWGFHPNLESRVEATCWACQALAVSNSPEETAEAVHRGIQYLRKAQLPDGSWPSQPEAKSGSWVTSLACWTLRSQKHCAQPVSAGLRWLCQDWPRDSKLWRRVLRKVSREKKITPQNDSYRGWGWTPNTSSWVEPTAFALLALQESPAQFRPHSAGTRLRLGEGLLYDRMCQDGGWDCGNPNVYGVPGIPLVNTTVWALLALRKHAHRPENEQSLAWLQSSIPQTQSAASLALNRICLEWHGYPWPVEAASILESYKKNGFLRHLPTMAWVYLALNHRWTWLSSESPRKTSTCAPQNIA